MATPMNAPIAGEIWHLSIEDLFQPVQEAPRLGGSGPFVINLSVSTAPITVPTKPFTSRQDAHVYQIQVTEDGRTRFRLRLGPFKSEDEADAILAEVRDTYPGALTATASGSDLRVIESMEAKVNQRQASLKAQAIQKVQVSQKAAADKAAIENFVAPKLASSPAPKPAAPEKAARNIIEAAVQAEIAKVEAEISIDLAWPLPELKVPTVALAPVAKAPIVPPVQAAAPEKAKPVPAPIPVLKTAAVVAPPAITPAVTVPVTVPEVKAAWVLPELDIPLPAAQAAAVPTLPAAHVVAEVAASPQKPFELKIEPPLSLVGDAPVLTEVVMPKKAPVKNVALKPVVAAPVLTEVVVPKAKVSKAAPVIVPTAGKPAPVVESVPVAVSAPAVMSAPAVPSLPAPVVAPMVVAPVAAAIVAPVVKPVAMPLVTPPVLAAAPAAPIVPAATITAPTSTSTSATGTVKTLVKAAFAPLATQPPPKPVPAPPAKTVAATAPSKPLPVIPQSLVMPRRGAPAKLAKPMPSKLKSLQHVVVATAPAPAPREVKKLEEPLPDLESTQTIRALTPKELQENDRWFVIQLSLADHAFDPEAVPNLDIFSEYRLYSVAGLDQGRVVHALRLGFFKEEIGAVAVASYLAAYWDKPTIKRVSVAERERFADQRVDARKDVGATGRHSVIEITDELVARRRRASQAPGTDMTPGRPAEH